jgi:hypothetical protein
MLTLVLPVIPVQYYSNISNPDYIIMIINALNVALNAVAALNPPVFDKPLDFYIPYIILNAKSEDYNYLINAIPQHIPQQQALVIDLDNKFFNGVQLNLNPISTYIDTSVQNKANNIEPKYLIVDPMLSDYQSINQISASGKAVTFTLRDTPLVNSPAIGVSQEIYNALNKYNGNIIDMSTIKAPLFNNNPILLNQGIYIIYSPSPDTRRINHDLKTEFIKQLTQVLVDTITIWQDVVNRYKYTFYLVLPLLSNKEYHTNINDEEYIAIFVMVLNNAIYQIDKTTKLAKNIIIYTLDQLERNQIWKNHLRQQPTLSQQEQPTLHQEEEEEQDQGYLLPGN